MSFKDLHYSLSRFKTDVRTQIAGKNPFQSQDTKALSMWIREERHTQGAMAMAAKHGHDNNQAFVQWLAQEDNDQGLQDLGYMYLHLMEKQVEMENEIAAKHGRFRQVIKSIRERDQLVLADLREKKQAVSARLEHLRKSSPNSKKQIQHLEIQLADVEKEEHERELEIGDYKRLALREAFHLRFNAMHEFAQKAAVLASAGQRLSSPSPSQQRDDPQQDEMLLRECMLQIDGWQPPEEQTRPTVLDKWIFQPEEDAALLTDLEIATATHEKQAAQMVASSLEEEMACSPPPPSAPPEYKEKAS